VGKVIWVLAFLWSVLATAAPSASIMNADTFKHALEQFKPGDVLSGFTPTPPEVSLAPEEDYDGLKTKGFDAMHQNKEASQIYNNGTTRTKVFQNPDSDYLQYAKRLIDSSESVSEGGCIAQPPSCTTESHLETCDEKKHYDAISCCEALDVSVNKRIHKTRRYVDRKAPMDLAHCAGRTACTPADEVHVSVNCHSVVVETKYNGYVVGTNHDQTCQSLLVNIDFKSYPHPGHSVTYDIAVTESVIEDHWDKSSCAAIADKVANGACIFQQGQACIDANATKVIDGIPITRSCWGARYQYQCFSHIESTCTPWITQGCLQKMSRCVRQDFGVCIQYSQTFECAHTTCIPQPDICMPSLPCTDGSCDTTKSEESHDMGEGVSRLGALTGAAVDVANNQINSGSPRIFAGQAMECKKYILGFRDCCTDSGWGDWVKHCPAELQELQKAKADNRVVYLGKYKEHKLDLDHHYAYCVFPSKLGFIIQNEGRKKQLGISFGKAKEPNCSGITPEQLERINFQKLNLSPIEQELVSRFQKPDLGRALQIQEAHIERLNQAGASHD